MLEPTLPTYFSVGEKSFSKTYLKPCKVVVAENISILQSRFLENFFILDLLVVALARANLVQLLFCILAGLWSTLGRYYTIDGRSALIAGFAFCLSKCKLAFCKVSELHSQCTRIPSFIVDCNYRRLIAYSSIIRNLFTYSDVLLLFFHKLRHRRRFIMPWQ